MAAGRKSEAERQELKLRKKLKQIQHLETLQRPLSKEELAKVGKKGDFLRQLAALERARGEEVYHSAEEPEEFMDEESMARVWLQEHLWGELGEKEYSVGFVRDMSPGHAELAATATLHYRRFKEEEARCSYRAWRELVGVWWRDYMEGVSKEMKSNLDRAIAYYRVALAKAQAVGARAAGRALARNLLLSLIQLVCRVRPHLRLAIYAEAAATFATAIELGGEDKAWLRPEGKRGVVAVFEEMVEELGSELSVLATTPRLLVRAGEAVCRSLDRWSKVEESRAALGLLNLRVGEVVFNRAAMAVANKEFHEANYLLAEMTRPVEEARSCFRGDQAMTREVELLELDMTVHSTLAKAIHDLHEADKELEDTVEGSEALSIARVRLCLDKYKQAVVAVVGQDTELVCMAYTKIAKIYLKVVRDAISKIKGKEYLMEVMEMSKALGEDKNLHSLEWFNLATSLLREIQEEAQRKEDEEWSSKRKVAVEGIKEELKQLAEHEADSDEDLVSFLLDKLPPRHRPAGDWRHLEEEVRASEAHSKERKRAFQKLVTIYHPDRVDKEKFDDKYHVLCEEICKELTSRYNNLKGA